MEAIFFSLNWWTRSKWLCGIHRQ